MSFTNIETALVQSYGTNVQMMAQQMGSKLRDKVRVENPTGERHYFELYNSTGLPSPVSERGQDILLSDTNFERRAVDILAYEEAKPISSFDMAQMLADPISPVVMEQAANFGRLIDSLIINSVYADMLTGKTGSTAVSPTTAIAINSNAYGGPSGNSNLTISKLIEASVALDANDVPMEDRYCVVDPVNHGKLLATAEATSADFITGRNLETGEINSLVGFKLIKHTGIPTDTNGYRRVFVFQKTGIGLAINKDVMADLSLRKDKSGMPYQAYICMQMAATRLENSKVREIKCLAT